MAVYSRYHSGEAVKTRNLSYAEWRSGARMLYNHRIDIKENINRADDPQYAQVLAKISALLKTHRQEVREADAAYAASTFGSEMISKNQPPAWRSANFEQKSTQVGESYSTYVNFRASDPDEDGLVYAKVSGPDWIQLTNSSYGRFQGTPSVADVGLNTLKVTVSDGINEPVEATMKVRVQASP
ncbi:MAG: Uncharacterised protein [Opitutia bacterium UBA7350]|nr:MAG: Uncharacterised protein [Opitutae bacterium UBA7350]